MTLQRYAYFGLISGFIAAIFEAIMFYSYDAASLLSPGYQFTAIGIRLLNISGIYGELYGLLLHFIVGTVVGFFAALISFYIPHLRIMTVLSGLGTGIFAGILILFLFSLPVNIYLLHLYIYEEYYIPSTFFYYTMHIFYGAVWGIFLGFFYGKYK